MFYAPAQDTQCPTHPRLHVRDARDAHTVFEAVRRGMLKPVIRRLNELERSTYIRSGALFVWEESDDEMGLKRWTDGKVWSGSRMREVGSLPAHKMHPAHGVSVSVRSHTYSTTRRSLRMSHNRQRALPRSELERKDTRHVSHMDPGAHIVSWMARHAHGPHLRSPTTSAVTIIQQVL